MQGSFCKYHPLLPSLVLCLDFSPLVSVPIGSDHTIIYKSRDLLRKFYPRLGLG